MKIFDLGFIHLPFFGLMIAIGFFIGLNLLKKTSSKYGYDKEKIENLAIYTLMGGLLGARISFILFYNFSFYKNNPLEVFKVYNGGMSIHGGIIGGFLVAFYYIKKHKEFDFYTIADLIAPPLILAQGIARVGCDVYGKVMDNFYFLGIKIGQYYYHPAQLYEFTLNYILFYYLYKKGDKKRYKGQLFGEYLIGFGLIRSIVELFRDNPKYFGLSISHYLSFGLVLAGYIFLKFMKKKSVVIEGQKGKNNYRVEILMSILYISSIFIYYFVQLNF